MKYAKHVIVLAVLGMVLFYPTFNKPVFADEKIVDFILKACPGGPALSIPDDFVKSGNDNHGYLHEGYIDGFRIICRTKGGIIQSLHAQKQFNTGDMSAEHTYNDIIGSVLSKLLKKYNGTLVNEESRGESTNKVPYDYGEYCYYTTLKGSGKTIKSKGYQLGFWYDLGVWKRCDNYGYNGANPGNVILEFRPSN